MHKILTSCFTGLLWLLTAIIPQNVQAQPNIVYQSVINSGLSLPIDIVNAGDGTNRLFVVEKGGAIKVYSAAYAFLGTLVTVSGISTAGERGLLSLAFHPNYETNRFFYVYYTTTDGTNTTYINIARYQTRADNANLADDTSRKVLMSIAKPTGPDFTNHNGGRLQFGPEGYLYFATGDGGSGNDPFNNAQNGNSLLGKMIRINVNVGAGDAYTAPYYTIPADNPYTSNGAVRDEIWALGLRNPFRWSFDRLTYDMWIGDVGQGLREEINYRANGSTGGVNYGWRCYEGNLSNANYPGCVPSTTPVVFPVYEYINTGGRAVTGGQVYRGSEFPTMYGVYLAADHYSGVVYKIRPNGVGGWSTTTQSGLPTFIAAFGDGEDGSMYAVALVAGIIYEVTTNTAVPLRLISFNAIKKTDHIEVSWKTAYEADLTNFEVEYSLDSRNYQTAQTVLATNNSSGSSYAIRHSLAAASVVYYRLKINNVDGSVQYSPVVTTSWDRHMNGAYIPGTVRNNRLLLTLYEPFTSLRLISPLGQTLFQKSIEGMTGFNEITLPQVQTGSYIIQLAGKSRQYSTRLVIAR